MSRNLVFKAADLVRRLEVEVNQGADLTELEEFDTLLANHSLLRIAEALEGLAGAALQPTQTAAPEITDLPSSGAIPVDGKDVLSIPTWARKAPTIEEHVNLLAQELAAYKRMVGAGGQHAAPHLDNLNKLGVSLTSQGRFGPDEFETTAWMVHVADLFAEWLNTTDDHRDRWQRALAESGCEVDEGRLRLSRSEKAERVMNKLSQQVEPQVIVQIRRIALKIQAVEEAHLRGLPMLDFPQFARLIVELADLGVLYRWDVTNGGGARIAADNKKVTTGVLTLARMLVECRTTKSQTKRGALRRLLAEEGLGELLKD